MTERPTYKLGRFLIALTAGIILLVIFVIQVGQDEIVDALLNVNAFGLIYTLSAQVFAMVASALSWLMVIRIMNGDVSLTGTIKVNFLAYVMDDVIPTGSLGGLLTRAYLSARDYDLPNGVAVSASLLHRIILFFPFIVASVVGVAYAGLYFSFPLLMFVPLALSIIAAVGVLAILLLMVVSESASSRVEGFIIGVAERFLSEERAEGVREELREVRETLDLASELVPKKLGLLALALLFAFATMAGEFFTMHASFVAVGLNPPLLGIVVVYSLFVLLNTVPVLIPGMVGILEPLLSLMYASLNIPLSLATGATLLLRIVTFWLPLVLGISPLVYIMQPTVSTGRDRTPGVGSETSD